MTRKEILDSAIQIITKDRQNQYGDAEDNFNIIADLWAVYLGRKLYAYDVAMMMILLKVARAKTGASNIDNYIDIAGYAACGGEIKGGANVISD